MSSFIKRLVLSVVASKLHRMAYRRGHNPAVGGLLREFSHHLGRRHRYGHYRHYGHRGHGHYRYHGHYRHKPWC